MLRAIDILGWDSVNWSACLDLWEPHIPATPCDCLEVGAAGGGPSLWMASKGHRVVCSDLDGTAAARKHHRQHGVMDGIRYEDIDITAIPYTESFDIVVFKSVMGGVWAHRGWDAMQQAVEEMRRCLRPKGKLFFAENLRATSLHMFCRTRLIHHGPESWRYPTYQEMLGLFSGFANIEYRLAGCLATFGRTESQRSFLGHIDRVLVPVLPRSWRYIMAGIATK